MKRPDLTGISQDIIEYIETLEEEIARFQASPKKPQKLARKADQLEEEPVSETSWVSEPPSSAYIISITKSGTAKRTPRHLYDLQRRGGMGIFDIESTQDDPPTFLTTAEPEQTLLLITNYGRAFRIPVQQIPDTAIHARGSALTAKFEMEDDENVSVLLPIAAEGYLALVGERGFVRLLRHHVFGEYMKPGTPLIDTRQFGMLAGACWTPGNADLLIASQQGKAIRFSEKSVAPQNTLGIKLIEGDKAVGIASVFADLGVFFLGVDGKGTVRLMEGFAPNKSPGSSGKIAIAAERLIAIAAVENHDHLMIITGLGKIIRFRVDEIPAKEGVVQGVACINLRADSPASVARIPMK